MWWEKKPQSADSSVPEPASEMPPPPPATPKVENPMNPTTTLRQPTPTPSGSQQTILGRTIVLRGQLSGNGDLLIEGQFDGNISLEDHCLTVGPDGQVKAEIHARQVVVMGSITGNITARDKVEIRRTGRVLGDLRAAGIAIEDGAYFKGSIEIVRDDVQEVPKPVLASSASGTDD
jgi:cytoskeletal protein CcmA (bactofilin family)